MNDPLFALIGAVVGFLGKSSWDMYWKRRHEKYAISHKKRLETLERQLNEFYWPLLFQLRKNDIVWKRIKKESNDDLEAELSYKLSRQYFFPNNEKMLEIVESKYFLAQPPEEVRIQIDSFIRHQAIFQGIRNVLEDDLDPIRFGERWPDGLLPAVEKHTLALQAEYDRILGIEK